MPEGEIGATGPAAGEAEPLRHAWLRLGEMLGEPLPPPGPARDAQLQQMLRCAGLLQARCRQIAAPPRAALTARERQCLALAAQGHSAAIIGRHAGISERTAVFHLKGATGKLGARSRQHAVALAVALGELELQPLWPQPV